MPSSHVDSRAGTALAHWRPELLLLLAAALVPIVAAPLNTDTGYILIAGRRLLQGQQLYVDLIETNPPLIFWMGALQVWAAQALSIEDARLMGWCVAILLGAAGIPAVRLLSGHGNSRLLSTTIIGVFLFAVIVPYVSWVGQREQIAAILTFPYVLLAARAAGRQDSSRGLSLWCGLLSGIGLAIKPFFLASWLALELLVLVCTRRWRSPLRPETLTVVIIQIGYVAAVAFFTPAYLADAVPMALQLYGAYGKNVVAIVSAWRFLLLVAIGVVTVVSGIFTRVDGSVRYAPAFGAATCGWLVCYVAQGKGWPYHLLPAVAYGSVAIAATAGETLRALRVFSRQSLWKRALAALTAVFIVVCSVAVLPRIPGVVKDAWSVLHAQQRGAVLEMVHYVEGAATGEPVYFLSTSMWPAFPVVNMARAQWPYRYHFLWPIPALYATGSASVPVYRAPDAQGAVERQFFDAVIDDLRRTPPRVLVVDRRTDLQAMQGQRFDFLEYFSGSEEFRTLMARYRRIGFIGPWEVFERF